MGWILTGKAMHNKSDELLPFLFQILRKDKFHVFISEWHWVLLSCIGAGAFCDRWLVVAALGPLFLMTVVNLHGTWLVNSATHMWGSQRFFTGDASTNSFWVAMLTFGEGWHNNHHAAPQLARHGLAWYEFDLNWYGIWTLQRLGLAWEIKLPKLTTARESPAPCNSENLGVVSRPSLRLHSRGVQ